MSLSQAAGPPDGASSEQADGLAMTLKGNNYHSEAIFFHFSDSRCLHSLSSNLSPLLLPRLLQYALTRRTATITLNTRVEQVVSTTSAALSDGKVHNAESIGSTTVADLRKDTHPRRSGAPTFPNIASPAYIAAGSGPCSVRRLYLRSRIFRALKSQSRHHVACCYHEWQAIRD